MTDPVRTSERPEATEPDERTSLRHRHAASTGIADRLTRRPTTHEDVDERYTAARDAWTTAMRAAQSGRPADLAALAVAQEEYEAALAEKQRWDSTPRVEVPVEPDRPTGIRAVVGQEFSWRRVHELEEQHNAKPKGLRGLVRRLRGR